VCPLLSHLQSSRLFFSNRGQYKIPQKFVQLQTSCSLRADGRTHDENVTFRNYAGRLNNERSSKRKTSMDVFTRNRKTNQPQNSKFKNEATFSVVNGFTQGRHSLFKRNVGTYKRAMKRVGVYLTVPIFGIINPFTSPSFASSQADYIPPLQGVNNFQGF